MMNFKLPLENDDSTTVFIRCIFHNMKRLSSRIICIVRSCRWESHRMLTLLGTVLCLMNLTSPKSKPPHALAT
jgi:hypothetical protein